MDLYQKLFRPIFFRFDPEWIHDRVMLLMKLVSRSRLANNLTAYFLANHNPAITVKLFGLKFNSPIGIPAGFDKGVEAPLAYGAFGFGAAELGSITYQSQPGNPKPRLWRLPLDGGLVVNYGLNNKGAIDAVTKLKKAKTTSYRKNLLGVSIARSTNIPEIDTVNDYLKSFKLLAPLADYVTLNVSCPNVVGYTNLQNKKFLNELLEKIQSYNLRKTKKPLFVKVGSDDLAKLLESVAVMVKYRVDAVIISNLLKGKRPKLKSANRVKQGGVSGKPLEKQANRAIEAVYRKYGDKIKIIGVGGIFTARDAYRKIKLGASLLQLFTGFIYGGPLTVSKINRELSYLLEKDGYKTLSEAVGKAKN